MSEGINKIKKKKRVSYAKWGYIFLVPFFATYVVFSLIPLFSTFYYSLFENYRVGLEQVGPTFVGLENFKTIILETDLIKYFINTFIVWVLGFVPQLFFSLLLAVWFTDLKLKLKATSFFKTVIYMPNLIMASAFAMLFFTVFADSGPINNMIESMGFAPYRFLSEVAGTRALIALMNFLMWFGNTTIILMAAIMGIDTGLYEAAQIDGATSNEMFRHITLPLIKPITLYVLITSLIGGLQMFDVPQILTNGKGSPNRTSMTIIMYLNNHLFSKNYGLGGALSVIIFIVTGILSYFVFKSMTSDNEELNRLKKNSAKKRKVA